MELFTTTDGWFYLARWGHFLFGITWIGLLYYFNFIQGAFFAETSAEARTAATAALVPRALWWFRWGAMLTFLTGLVMLGIIGAGLTYDILLGAIMGILMFLNVWLIIWPNQKIVIASAQGVQEGREALPEAAAAGPKALLASRTNTLFSVPMLFFMGSSAHFSQGGPLQDASTLSLVLTLVLIAAIEANAIFGKPGPIQTVKGVITSGFVLTLVFWALVRFL